MDEKVTSNGNVEVWAIPAASIADISALTAAEINAGVMLGDALAWDGVSFPANTGSNDVDDRSIRDRGNATSRGFAQFESTLSFFRPLPTDTTSEAAVAWNFFKTPRVPTVLVTRVLQAPEGVATDAAAGQWYSAYEFMSDTVNDQTEGENSVKYIVSFMPQGSLAVYSMVKIATAPILSKSTMALAVGDVEPVRATLDGKRATQVVTWLSSNPAVATVSPNGVVKAVSTGTANITATHPAASGPSTACAVTVA